MQQLAQDRDRKHGALSASLRLELDMDRADAREIASYVLDAFAGREELDDDHLDPDLRAIFYTLEGKRLLSFRREEYRNEEGYIRRAFYWRIRWEQVDADQAPEGPADEPAEASIYDELPGSAWSQA